MDSVRHPSVSTDTLSVLAAGLRDAGACGLYGTAGWEPVWLPLFRRAGRVYAALDRDATDRAVALARTFGTRGRVLIPPEDLGTKGDLNDWLRLGARAIPPRSGRCSNGRSRRARRLGRFRSSGCHRTWRCGNWMTIP